VKRFVAIPGHDKTVGRYRSESQLWLYCEKAIQTIDCLLWLKITNYKLQITNYYSFLRLGSFSRNLQLATRNLSLVVMLERGDLSRIKNGKHLKARLVLILAPFYTSVNYLSRNFSGL